MIDLLLLFVPFFALVLMGWGAARGCWLPLEGIPAMNSFVLFFGLSAMLFRLGASGALHQSGLLGLLLAYGLAGAVVTVLALVWGTRQGLIRRDGGLVALATAFPNTGFLGLPLLTGLLGPQAAGPIAATLLIDVLLLSSLCLAWAHSHATRDALGDDPAEAWHAAQASLKGALRNPLLWSMALGMLVSWLGWTLPHAVDETVRLLGLAGTPTALFTLGAILARAQMQPARAQGASVSIGVPLLLKLVVHPLLVCLAGWALVQAGVALSPSGWLTLILAAALPSASNVSMLAEREGAKTSLVARIILWTTACALLSLTLWASVLHWQFETIHF
ncbi:AEC family transporter [Aquabacterium sp.]|uniref:AEC family transporter n=1 Tax=Aquabacterium sp. TaxID=1872578 RepID=UPI00248805D6|nr:AEC family transporter [Aquabacterium sp.]MDI1260552.1 AEC family transporter [Aquabacterium sp.]